jgi:hypothetical protein
MNASALHGNNNIAYDGSFWTVNITTGYGLDDRGVRVRVLDGSRIFTSPYRPGWLWGPPILHYVGFGLGGGAFPRGNVAGTWSWPLTSN